MKFRKRPVVIDAIQWLYHLPELEQWVLSFGVERPVFYIDHGQMLVIRTLEGNMLCSYGDWIIRGVNGEFYPCKPDIFEKTYEAVSSDEGFCGLQEGSLT